MISICYKQHHFGYFWLRYLCLFIITVYTKLLQYFFYVIYFLFFFSLSSCSPRLPGQFLRLWITNQHERQSIGDHDQTALDRWLRCWRHSYGCLNHFAAPPNFNLKLVFQVIHAFFCLENVSDGALKLSKFETILNGLCNRDVCLRACYFK